MEQENSNFKGESQRRLRALNKLKRDLGLEFINKFYDPLLVEVMINPGSCGGGLFWERLGEPMQLDKEMSEFFNSIRVESIIRTVAGYYNKEITEDNPILECNFPLDRSRFTGIIPPVVSTPSFTIRKKPNKIFTLEEYVEKGSLTIEQMNLIKEHVKNHENILVIGGTSSGKTTLTNAIIHEMSVQFPDERFFISEDTGEILSDAKNLVQCMTTVNVDLTKIIKTALRYRPDRIIVGEVRGPESLDLLDAWNTGHPGGIATIHADSAIDGMLRLESLVSRNPAHPKNIRQLIASVIKVGIFIKKNKKGRRVEEIIRILGVDENNNYIFKTLA